MIRPVYVNVVYAAGVVTQKSVQEPVYIYKYNGYIARHVWGRYGKILTRSRCVEGEQAKDDKEQNPSYHQHSIKARFFERPPQSETRHCRTGGLEVPTVVVFSSDATQCCDSCVRRSLGRLRRFVNKTENS